jgi:hypothetical protein
MRIELQQLKMVAVLLVAIACCPWMEGQAAPQQRVVRGVVFNDANGNARRDAGERGLAGVAVSDQAAVVQTNADGTYELGAAAESSVVFVSIPDGWSAPAGFWRALKFEGDAARADFALQRRETKADFTFIHASDTHLSPQSLPRIRRLREIVQRERPAFVLLSGDLVRDALRVKEEEARGYYDLLMAELRQFPVPVWTIPGNHEVFGIERHLSLVSPQHPLYGKKMYRHYLGPNYFSFTWSGIHFVGLDTIDVDDLWYYGHIDAAQLVWLRKDLAALPPDTPVVTFNHIPLASAVENLNGYTEEPPAPSVIRVGGRAQYRHTVSNTAELLAALGTHRLEIALGGHMHTRETLIYQTENGPMRFYQTGAVVGPNEAGGLKFPSGVTLYRVRNGKVDDGTFILLDTGTQ